VCFCGQVEITWDKHRYHRSGTWNGSKFLRDDCRNENRCDTGSVLLNYDPQLLRYETVICNGETS
jgi:hypothetical protein